MISSFKSKVISTFIFLLFLSAITWIVVSYLDTQSTAKNDQPPINSHKPQTTNNKDSAAFIKAVTDTHSSQYHIINVSDSESLSLYYGIDKYAGKQIIRVYTGRRINIAITGVDSRLGSSYKHADANHILSILVDQGLIEIISIPRDTYADAGYDDTTGQNKLTVLRASKGRSAYLKEIANIAGLDKIHYYVELGFSQAIGILEWLGYKETSSTLQVLRSRTGLGGDDYQRAYNQAQFIRQMILRHFDKFKGIFGTLLIKGGLALVESNITSDKAIELVELLDTKQFPMSPDDITIKIRPPVVMDYKVYDFTDENVLVKLKNKIEGFNEKVFFEDSANKKATVNVISRLESALNRAVKDTAKNPQRVITTLQTYFDQRAWLQVKDTTRRYKIRDQFAAMLSSAYNKKKQYDKANNVINTIESEKALFNYKIKQ